MVFADSSGFIAVFQARDAGHQDAERAWRDIQAAREGILTTSFVLAETVTIFRRRLGWEASRRVGEGILRSRGCEVVYPTREETEAAWRELVRNPAPKVSLCDALSFVIMRHRGIARALTFDRHFAEAGFAALPWA